MRTSELRERAEECVIKGGFAILGCIAITVLLVAVAGLFVMALAMDSYDFVYERVKAGST